MHYALFTLTTTKTVGPPPPTHGVAAYTGSTPGQALLHCATIISGPRHTILTGLGAPYRYTRNLA